MLGQLLQGIRRRIPSQCAVCHAWPSDVLCEPCVTAFAQPVHRCRTCALPLVTDQPQCGQCVLHPPPWDQCLAAVTYAYPWSGLIQAFKFREQPAWARNFATLMHAAPWIEPALDAADLLIPMPISNERLRERGFNQTLQMARHLAPDKVANDVLLRVRDTPAQSTLPRKARLDNVANAFAVEPLRIDALKGKRVVLLDDVMTSGASLHSAATSLRKAGVGHLCAMVFARTGHSEDALPADDLRQ